MPARPMRRRSQYDAGPTIPDDRPLATVPEPVTPAAAEQPAKPRKFTALLDAATDARYGRLLDSLRESVGPVATRSDGNGRTRAGYDVSRADLLRALLEVAEGNDLYGENVMDAVSDKVRRHYSGTL